MGIHFLLRPLHNVYNLIDVMRSVSRWPSKDGSITVGTNQSVFVSDTSPKAVVVCRFVELHLLKKECDFACQEINGKRPTAIKHSQERP